MNGHPKPTSNNDAEAAAAAAAPDIGISDAMLERMIERKLAMLDNEYEQCVNAVPANEPPQEWNDGNDPSWSDLDDISDDDTPTPYEHHSDEEKTNDTVDVHAYTQIAAVRDGEQNIIQNNDIADWDAFRDPSQPQHAQPEESYEPAYKATPMSEEHINKIKNMMSTVKLKPPPWAIGVPEEIWMSRILQHAGFRPTQSATTTTTITTSTSTDTDTDTANIKKKKKKKKTKQPIFSAEEEDGFGAFASATSTTTITTTSTSMTVTETSISTSTEQVTETVVTSSVTTS